MSYDSIILGDGPKGYWPLTDLSGTSAKDLSGNSNHGTYTGTFTLNQAGPIKGDPGGCVLLGNGTANTDGKVTLPNTPLPSGASFSVEAWVYNINAAGGQNGVIGAGNFGVNPNNFIDLQFNNGSFRWEANNSAANNQVTTNGAYQALWLHIVLAVSGGIAMVGYINNVAVLTQTITTGTFNLGNNNWKVGQWDGFLNGYAGRVAMYSYGLSAAQVTRHYNAGKYGASSGAIGNHRAIGRLV